jgi:hypothetical protein
MDEPRDGGFSRVDFTGEAGSAPLQGFERSSTEIMQGYMGADPRDLEEWDFLVTMEHPIVLNGIQSLQGKAKRQERKAKRQEKREDKKADKKQDRAARPAKQKRQEKKNVRQQRRTDKKDLKLAKKEEKVLKRQSNREQKALDREARRLRKSERGENVKQIFDNLGDKVKDVVSKIVTRPDQLDLSLSDMNLTDQAMPFFDRWQGMDPEEVLDEREELMMDKDVAEGAGADAGPVNEPTGSGGGGAALAFGAIALLALAGGKKGKKKK